MDGIVNLVAAEIVKSADGLFLAYFNVPFLNVNQSFVEVFKVPSISIINESTCETPLSSIT